MVVIFTARSLQTGANSDIVKERNNYLLEKRGLGFHGDHELTIFSGIGFCHCPVELSVQHLHSISDLMHNNQTHFGTEAMQIHYTHVHMHTHTTHIDITTHPHTINTRTPQPT